MTTLRRRKLAEALDAFLALPGTLELLDPPLWAHAQALCAALKNAAPDDAAGIGMLTETGREAIRARRVRLDHEVATLTGLLRHDREVAERLGQALAAEQRQGKEAWQSFGISRKLIARQGVALLARLGGDNLDKLIARNREDLLASPTTGELTQSMQALADQAAGLFDSVEYEERQIGVLVEAVYARFNATPGFALSRPRRVDLDDYRRELAGLAAKTREFCRSRINLITDKNSLAKKFGQEVAAPLRDLFARLGIEAERWLEEVSLLPQVQLRDRKAGLERREENLGKILDHFVTLETRLEEAQTALAWLRRQEEGLERVLACLSPSR
ncbi:MAG: hypothetical protein PHX38_03855 [Sulfuricella sp.]|nr:hypothetical protein [Sulfuricella sp.]